MEPSNLPTDRLFIVASGPSARGFDFRKLKGSYVIAVNDSFLSIPEAHAVVSIDREYILDRAAQLIRFPGSLFTLHKRGEMRPWMQCGQRCWLYQAEPGLSDTWDIVHTGGCSGSAALNVAYLMRPQFIGLIGFDYDGSGKHWYDDQTRKRSGADVWQRWAAWFDTAVPQLQSAGIDVVNFNPNSKIAAFKRRSLDTIAP